MLDGISPTAAAALVACAAFAVNVPFGWWRAGLPKFSPAWFVAVHAAVPVVVGTRLLFDVPFRWITLPLFVACYFAGQATGAKLRVPA
ncbi:MAG: hypothetical protein O9284_11990 [Steroidobacteraceae bacterium]|jgi:hypothetical protein|nr:hypothetical protein [Steroidobacteraceae bacterium]